MTEDILPKQYLVCLKASLRTILTPCLKALSKNTTQLITYRFLSVNTEHSLTWIAHIPTLLESGKDSALMIHTLIFTAGTQERNPNNFTCWNR